MTNPYTTFDNSSHLVVSKDGYNSFKTMGLL